MTIRHLKIFVTVADWGKMRTAAEKLYISQPAISQAIKELESYYNVKLFERLSQRLYLTEDGSKLLAQARCLVEAFENLDLMMKNQGATPKLSIGGSVSVGTYLLNDIIDEMEALLPEARFKVMVHNTSTIETLIKTGQLDIALVEGTVTCEELIQIPVFEDELVIIVGKGHPLYTRDFVNLEELENQVWISREEGSINRNQYEQLLLEKQCTIKHQWICTNTETIKQTVSRGRGLAIISRMLINHELPSDTFRILPVRNIKVTRSIKIIYHKDKYLTNLIETFISVSQNHQIEHLNKSIQ